MYNSNAGGLKMSAFAKNLTTLINVSGKSQVDICKDIGISKQKLSNLKAEYSEPNIDDLIVLANYFGISTDYLLGIENEEGNIVFSDSVLQLSDLESELIKVFRSLPDKYKLQALGLMQGFAHSIRL